MKNVLFVFAALTAILSLPSCTQNYTCGRQCHVFNNGSIKICEATSADSVQFNKSTDSLANLYGSYTSVFADSVSVSGNSTNAVNTVTNQLQKQGYTCNCNN